MNNENLTPKQIVEMLSDDGVICLERFSYLSENQKNAVIEYAKKLSEMK